LTKLYHWPQDEDAYDMRKALRRDVDKKSIIPLDRDVHIDELEY
jgi:N-terminal acetyltransferase B complex catalytic subunit